MVCNILYLSRGGFNHLSTKLKKFTKSFTLMELSSKKMQASKIIMQTWVLQDSQCHDIFQDRSPMTI